MDEQQTKVIYMEIIHWFIQELKSTSYLSKRLKQEGIQDIFEVH